MAVAAVEEKAGDDANADIVCEAFPFPCTNVGGYLCSLIFQNGTSSSPLPLVPDKDDLSEEGVGEPLADLALRRLLPSK